MGRKMKMKLTGIWVLFLVLLGAPAVAQSTQCVTSAVAGGTANALTVPLLPCGLATNILILKLAATNTSTTPTLQMTGYSALPIVDSTTGALTVGALVSGATVYLTGTGTKWLLMSNAVGPAGPAGPAGPVGPAGSGVLPTVVVATSGATISPAASTQVLIVDKTVGSATGVVLPAVSNWPDCAAAVLNSCPTVEVKDGKGDAGTNQITVTTADGATIDGGVSSVLAFNYQSVGYVLSPAGTWSVQ